MSEQAGVKYEYESESHPNETFESMCAPLAAGTRARKDQTRPEDACPAPCPLSRRIPHLGESPIETSVFRQALKNMCGTVEPKINWEGYVKFYWSQPSSRAFAAKVKKMWQDPPDKPAWKGPLQNCASRSPSN